MGYSKAHIEQTKQRILDCAGMLFRQFGYSGVGIDKIMNTAGLTRGGFYAHFKSKRQLFAEVIGQPFDFTRQVMKLQENPPPGVTNGALFCVRYYLGSDTRDHVAQACTMASSAVDAAAAPAETKANFEARLDDLVSQLQRLFAEDGKAFNESQVRGIIATSVGGLILSRACSDSGAEAMLEAVRQSVEDAVRAA